MMKITGTGKQSMNSKVTKKERKRKMKRTKFIQRTVSAFLAAALFATLASSCSLPGTKGGDAPNQPRVIENYYTTEICEKPAGVGYINSMTASGDNIFIYGYRDSSEAKTIAMAVNAETKKTSEFNLDGIEAEYKDNAYYFGDSILLMYTTKKDYQSMIALVSPSTGEIITERKMTQNSYVMDARKDADGNILVIEEGWNGANNTTVCRTLDPKTLEVKSSLDLSSALGTETKGESYISAVEFDEEGSAYVFVTAFDSKTGDQECKVVKTDKTGKVVYTLDNLTDLEGGGTLFKRADGSMCILSSLDYQTFFFNVFDKATGDVTARYEAELKDEIRSIAPGYPGADLVYSTEKGFYGFNIETGKSEEILKFGPDVPEEAAECYRVQFFNGEFFFFGQSYGDAGSGFSIIDRDGNLKMEIPVEDDLNITAVRKGNDGEILVMAEDYSENASVPYVLVYDGDGNMKTKIKLESDSDDSEESENVYVQDVSLSKSGNIVAVVQTFNGEQKSYLNVYDMSGKFLNKIENDEVSYIQGYISSDEGEFIQYYGNGNGSGFLKIDTDNGTTGEKKDMDIPEDARFVQSDGSYDYCYSTSEGLYGYSFADGKSSEIVNWVDSDILFEIDNVIVSEDSIICTGYDYEIGDTQLYKLKRADDATLKKIQNKKIITVAGVDIGYSNFREKVVDFNRNSDEYRIQVNDYGKYSKFEDDTYTSGAFQLNSDMSAGNVPDIIVGSPDTDMTAFAAKNIITDLNPFFEKDKNISREDYFENILDAFSYNGKLTQLVTSFTLSSIVVPDSKAGTEVGWTADQFLALKKNGRIFHENTLRDELVYSLFKTNLGEYVDFENKKCDFDNDRFAALIDFIAEEGKEPEKGEDSFRYGIGIEDEDTQYFARYKDKKCQAEFISVSDIFDILQLEQGAVGEPVTLKGLPSENGTGPVIMPSTTFAICEKSKNKDAAWEFISSFITEEKQDSLSDDWIYAIPLRKSSFEKLINKAKQTEYCQSYSVTMPDGSAKEMKPLDSDTEKKIRAAVEGASRIEYADERIAKIIDEALEPVFAGDSSAKEAAAQIQSKASKYLSEIR